MTDYNKYNPWPDEATVRCPACGDRAVFRFSLLLIHRDAWDRWLPRLWPCARATNWERTARWEPADRPETPSWKGWIIIEHDPALFRWKSPPQGYRRSNDGVLFCAPCGGRRKHVLSWPDDAWYRFGLRRGVLWAWSRPHLDALIAFIESSERDASAHGPYFLFLKHIPGEMLAANARGEIVKRLRRDAARLDGGVTSRG